MIFFLIMRIVFVRRIVWVKMVCNVFHAFLPILLKGAITFTEVYTVHSKFCTLIVLELTV